MLETSRFKKIGVYTCPKAKYLNVPKIISK